MQDTQRCRLKERRRSPLLEEPSKRSKERKSWREVLEQSVDKVRRQRYICAPGSMSDSNTSLPAV